jgi:hypothetical protein
MYKAGQIVKVRDGGSIKLCRVVGFSSRTLTYVVAPMIVDITSGHPFYAQASDIFPQ